MGTALKNGVSENLPNAKCASTVYLARSVSEAQNKLNVLQTYVFGR
jgi:hypothetical protein